MSLHKTCITLCCFVFVLSFSDAVAVEERRGRLYDVRRDIGFRWRTTLNVKYGVTQIDSDAEHSRLKTFVTGCNPVFRVNNANVATSSLQVVFKDFSSKLIPVEAVVYTKNLKDMPEKTRVNCFSTACLTIGEGDQARHPPITYKNRETLDFSIPFIFKAISMNTDCVTAIPTKHLQYDYRDTEFQIVHELFSTEEYGFVPGRTRREPGRFQNTKRKQRLVELFTSIIGGKNLEDVELIILHIHTKFDPCSVCAEMLCNLSQTLNYCPKALLKSEEPQIKQLCEQLKTHKTQFLIEVSSDDPCWNSREAGLDQFYMVQLSGTDWGTKPIEILGADKFPPEPSELLHTAIISNVTANVLPFSYFPPFVVFKRLDPPVIFKCLKMDREKSIADISPKILEASKVKSEFSIIAQSNPNIAIVSEVTRLFNEGKKEEVLSKLCNEAKVIEPFREILDLNANLQNRRNVLDLEAALRGSPEYIAKKDAALEGIITFLRTKL